MGHSELSSSKVLLSPFYISCYRDFILATHSGETLEQLQRCFTLRITDCKSLAKPVLYSYSVQQLRYHVHGSMLKILFASDELAIKLLLHKDRYAKRRVQPRAPCIGNAIRFISAQYGFKYHWLSNIGTLVIWQFISVIRATKNLFGAVHGFIGSLGLTPLELPWNQSNITFGKRYV